MGWKLIIALLSFSLWSASLPAMAVSAGGANQREEAIAGWGAAFTATRQGTPEDMAATAICPPPDTAAEAAPDWLGPEPPLEAATTLVAEAVVDQLPEGAAMLHLSQLSLAPATTTPTFQSSGTALLAVYQGSVTIHVEGEPVLLGAGESVSLGPGNLYALENGTTSLATLVRVAVVPLGEGSAKISAFAAPTIEPASSAGSRPDVTVLVQGAPVDLPASPGRLFLLCLYWSEPGSDAMLRRHPGAVGLWLERGTLGLDDQRALPTAGCAVFAAGEAHQAHSGEAATTALLFGLIPAAAALWQPADSDLEATAVASVVCGDPAA